MHDDILSAIEVFYDCAENAFDYQRALSTFSGVLDDTGLCLVDFRTNAKFTLLGYSNIPEDSMAMMLNGPWRPENHGVLRHFARFPVGVPVLQQSIESDEEFLSSELYRRAMQPWNLHSIGLTFLDKGPGGGMINGFLRTSGKTEIDAGLLSKMSILNTHLWRAIRLNQRIEKVERMLIQTSNVLDLIEFGLVLHGTDGLPVFVNAAARSILNEKDGLSLDRTAIIIYDRSAQTRYRAAMDGFAQAGTQAAQQVGGLIKAHRTSRKRPYCLLPVPMNLGGTLGLKGRGVAVLIFDPVAERTSSVDLFTAAYSLTPAESRLAAALVGGSSLEDYAAQTGVTRNTAKTHLASVFAKTDTSRQPELVSLLLRAMIGIKLKPATE
jgi:DNA-binding CsgD family transcriptional regulator